MHFCFVLVALAATWQSFSPVASVGLQTFAPGCEDLSPHCPALCASCEVAAKWPVGSHESFELFEPELVLHPRPSTTPPPPTSPAQNSSKLGASRPKRFANHHARWVQVPEGGRPGWLPSWIPWVYKPRPAGQQPNGSKPPQGGKGSRESGESGPPAELPSKQCGDLVNTGRQLVEAFCPKSCGRCGKSSNPLAAAQVYIGAQCTVAKEPMVGLAKE